jgi:tetratricopeptide (TPR) repeat protein
MQNDLQRAFLCYQRGDRQQAAKLGKRILKRDRRAVDAMFLLGLIEKDRDDFAKARDWFRRGLKIAPTHLNLLNGAGLLEKHMGNHAPAEVLLKKALAADPGYFHARYNLANLYDSMHDYARAAAQYRRVLEQQPDHVEALANLSSILEAEHQLEEARSLAQQALQINYEHFIARLTLANIATREKAFGEVVNLLGPLIKAGRLSPVNHSVAVGKCAFAFEKQGDYETAFSYYQAANQVLYQAFAPSMQNLQSLYAPEAVEQVGDTVADFEFDMPSGEVDSPVFLVGFPRSGTTLLDQVLTSHSLVTVLEERENLIDAYTRFPATESGLRELQEVSDKELSNLRRKYWGRVKEELGAEISGQFIIDKQPLNVIALLHIARLFPKAKILVALRDPRDCVFSCFQQRFGMSQAMFQFLQLDTAVSYYGKVMNIVTAMRDADVLPMHFVRYERVISDYREEVEAMTGFLGLEWEDALLDYQSTARSRHISTPSASQVIQPLYTSSIGKWRNFQPWIGDQFEPLESWVREWDYPE